MPSSHYLWLLHCDPNYHTARQIVHRKLPLHAKTARLKCTHGRSNTRCMLIHSRRVNKSQLQQTSKSTSQNITEVVSQFKQQLLATLTAHQLPGSSTPFGFKRKRNTPISIMYMINWQAPERGCKLHVPWEIWQKWSSTIHVRHDKTVETRLTAEW